MKSKHLHPVTIWGYLSRFSFLLLLPAVQILLSRPKGWILFSNLIGLFLVVSLAVFQYLACGYRIGERELTYKSGILLRKSRLIPTQSFLSAIVRLTPPLSLFGAAQLYLDTPAGSKRNADIVMALSKKGLLNLWDTMTAQSKLIYHASNTRILLMAASWSNPASGLLLAAVLLNHAGRLVGQELTERLYATVNQSYMLVTLGIPPATAFLGYLLAAGWAVAFLNQFLHYANFSIGTVPTVTDTPIIINSEDDAITTTRGYFVKNRQLLSRNAICAISVRQTLVMRIFKLYSAYLHTFGSGKEKGDRSLLFAAINKHELRQNLAALFHTNPLSTDDTQNQAHPSKSAFIGFLFAPVFLLIGALSLIVVLYWVYPEFAPLVFFSFPPILWQFAIHYFAWHSSKLCVKKDTIIASGYSRLTLYTACIPHQQLQRISVQQNFIQRFSGQCTLQLCTGAEKTGCFVVNHLNKQEVLKLLEI